MKPDIDTKFIWFGIEMQQITAISLNHPGGESMIMWHIKQVMFDMSSVTPLRGGTAAHEERRKTGCGGR